MIDTSTEAVAKMMDDVTPGPWGFFQGGGDDGNAYFGVTAGTGDICSMSNAYEWRGKQTIANARFIAAARDLVPALLAERDALRRENENLRQIERNVQAVREHEYNRAEAALAEVERLKAQPVTVHDAAKVPEIAALIEAVSALGAMPEGYCFCSENRVGDESKQHEPECRDLRAAIKSFGW